MLQGIFALKKKFTKRPEIVTFLSSLGKERTRKHFLEYMKELVNCGSIFQINDAVFCFIEMIIGKTHARPLHPR